MVVLNELAASLGYRLLELGRLLEPKQIFGMHPKLSLSTQEQQV